MVRKRLTPPRLKKRPDNTSNNLWITFKIICLIQRLKEVRKEKEKCSCAFLTVFSTFRICSWWRRFCGKESSPLTAPTVDSLLDNYYLGIDWQCPQVLVLKSLNLEHSGQLLTSLLSVLSFKKKSPDSIILTSSSSQPNESLWLRGREGDCNSCKISSCITF